MSNFPQQQGILGTPFVYSGTSSFFDNLDESKQITIDDIVERLRIKTINNNINNNFNDNSKPKGSKSKLKKGK